MRITSFTHYRPIRSSVDTGSLCTLSTKPSRGSTLHTSETNYTLKYKYKSKLHTWNTERSFLQSKAFVQSERSASPTSRKREKEERGVPTPQKAGTLSHFPWPDASAAFPSGGRACPLGTLNGRGKTGLEVGLQGSAMLTPEKPRLAHPWRTGYSPDCITRWNDQ